MADKQDEIDIPWWQKILAMGVIFMIVILLFVIATAILGKPSKQERSDRAIQSCGANRFSYEIGCPDPTSGTDKVIENINSKYPDDSY